MLESSFYKSRHLAINPRLSFQQRIRNIAFSYAQSFTCLVNILFIDLFFLIIKTRPKPKGFSAFEYIINLLYRREINRSPKCHAYIHNGCLIWTFIQQRTHSCIMYIPTVGILLLIINRTNGIVLQSSCPEHIKISVVNG